MPRFTANLSMLYGEVDFLDRFAAAAKDGFKGVEYLFPYDFPKETVAEKLKAAGVEQVLHNLPAGNWGAGERGIGCLPDRVDEFRAGVAKAIDYATALGCKQVNCLAGIAPAGVAPDVLRATLVSNLGYAAAELRKAGIRLLLEAINTRDIPGFFVDRSAQAIAIMDEVGSDNLFFQYDFYHMQIMEGDLTPTFKRLKDRIAHVQIADNPGRNEPGTGEINYGFIFRMLDAEGYAGWVGAEYRPKAGTSAGLGWMKNLA
ncbi:MAG: hydroxypyruvate isomerase [Bauldia sp.]|nr:hydroxypyruvate isomerase [Bauldia sp.]